MPTERPFAQGGRSTMKPNTIIAVTSDDARHRPVLDRAVSLANESGATVILYDLDADLGPLMSPLPTQWSGEGEQEQFGDRLEPNDLEAAGQGTLADQVRVVRAAGVKAFGWLPPKADAESLADYAARQSADLVLVSTEERDLVQAFKERATDGRGDRAGSRGDRPIHVEAIPPACAAADVTTREAGTWHDDATPECALHLTIQETQPSANRTWVAFGRPDLADCAAADRMYPLRRDPLPTMSAAPLVRAGLIRAATSFAVASMLVAALAPAVSADEGLEITTQYPAVAVAPGSKVSFDLNVASTRTGNVALALDGVPAGWTATLHGGGFVVDGVAITSSKAATARLDVSVPGDATAETQTIRI